MEQDNTLISIGRQFGSGGSLVAQAAGRELGLPVYDNELISKAAEESGISRDLFLKNDERHSLFSFPNFSASGGQLLPDGESTDSILFKLQSRVIRELAEKGGAIFIGRCSDYLLRDLRDRLTRVFLTAPLDCRIRRIAERHGLSPEEAGALIRKKDRTREAYYNYYTLGNWGCACSYDLCIDTSRLGIAGTAALIIDFVRRKRQGRGS